MAGGRERYAKIPFRRRNDVAEMRKVRGPELGTHPAALVGGVGLDVMPRARLWKLIREYGVTCAVWAFDAHVARRFERIGSGDPNEFSVYL